MARNRPIYVVWRLLLCLGWFRTLLCVMAVIVFARLNWVVERKDGACLSEGGTGSIEVHKTTTRNMKIIIHVTSDDFKGNQAHLPACV